MAIHLPFPKTFRQFNLPLPAEGWTWSLVELIFVKEHVTPRSIIIRLAWAARTSTL